MKGTEAHPAVVNVCKLPSAQIWSGNQESVAMVIILKIPKYHSFSFILTMNGD